METIFLQLLNRSVAASWLILAILFLRIVLRKAPKSLFCILWALVAIRLVFSISISSGFSLVPSAETISPTILYETTPTITSGIPAVNAALNPVISKSLTPVPGDSANPIQILLSIISRIWAAGALILFVYAVFSYHRLSRKVSTAVRLEDRIYQCDTISTPFVLGFFRPKIYLPFQLPQDILPFVIAHEKAHIVRRDHWIKPIGYFILCLYWFHPLVWVAYGLLCRDIELACDERVIRHYDSNTKKAYSLALLQCSSTHKAITACPLAFGEVGVKQRIRSVLNYRKPAFWIVILAVAACIVAALCFLTNPPGEESPDLSFLNYKNAISLCIDQPTIQAIYYPNNEEKDVSHISLGETSGSALAAFLAKDWSQRKMPSQHLPSAGSVEFIIRDDYRITFYQSKLAIVSRGEEQRCYKISESDYWEAVQLVKPIGLGNLNGQYVVEAILYSNPFFSSYPPGLDAVYEIGDNQFLVLSTDTKQVITQYSDVSWTWDPLSNEAFSQLFPPDTAYPNIEAYDGKSQRIATISETYRLLSIDGRLWLLIFQDDGFVRAVYQLTPASVPSDTAATSSAAAAPEPTEETNLSLESAVSQAIVSHSDGDVPANGLATQAHTILLTDYSASTGVITVYAIALYQEFLLENNKIQATVGSHMPVAITFDTAPTADDTAASYRLLEYWIPEDGANYQRSLQEKFPSSIYEQALDIQAYALPHMQACYQQAIIYSSIDTKSAIAGLIEEICSEPAAMSNPAAYLSAHPLEVQELTYYGDYTLDYCFSRFESGQEVGLEGHIMAYVCQLILNEQNIRLEYETGQDWYAAYLEYALQLQSSHGDTWMQVHTPAAWHLLEIHTGNRSDFFVTENSSAEE